MKEKGNILNNFILNTLKEENSLNIQFITNQDISKLVKLIESTSVEQLNISPSVQDIKETSDLFIVLEDIELKESEIGIIKNLLSQKIVIFSIPRDGVKESNMIKLGFQVELEDSKNKILCFSYYLCINVIKNAVKILKKVTMNKQ